MKQVKVMRAVSGAGKSTYAKKLAERALETSANPDCWPVKVVSADNYFVNQTTGEYEFDRSKLSDAHADCFKQFIEALQLGTNLVIVDNTNTSAMEISPYMLGAKAFGYDAEIIQLNVSSVKEAAKRNIHGVPKKTVKDQLDKIDRWIPPWWPRTVIESDI